MWNTPYNSAPYNAPLHNVSPNELIPNLPRDSPYQPEPEGWALYLASESSDPDSGLTVPDAEGRRKQTAVPEIKPYTRETFKYAKDTELGMFKLRCDASGHETILHKYVVLDQSKWLRDRVDPSTSHHWDPVHIPRQFKYWHVAWAIEYMYEGRVPGFHLLAGEEWPTGRPHFHPRSIASGLLELWEVANFFGLEGLKERAEGAFAEYFIHAIPQAVATRHWALATGETESGRVAFEFRGAAWKIFGDPGMLPKDYFELHMPEHEYTNFTILLRANWMWESAIFDRIPWVEAPCDGAADMGPVPLYRATFKEIMMELCPLLLERGMGRLQWFQRFLSPTQFSYCSAEFRKALYEKMGAVEFIRLTRIPTSRTATLVANKVEPSQPHKYLSWRLDRG